MSRRPGVPDRHALLSGGSYPRSSASAVPTSHSSAPRSNSPYEQPYSLYGSSHAPPPHDEYAEYGAPKKEYALSGGGLPGPNGVGAQAGGLAGRLRGYAASAMDLEEQNDAHLEGLSAKVKILKSVSCQMGETEWMDEREAAETDALVGHAPPAHSQITLGIGQEVRDSTAEMGILVSTSQLPAAWVLLQRRCRHLSSSSLCPRVSERSLQRHFCLPG